MLFQQPTQLHTASKTSLFTIHCNKVQKPVWNHEIETKNERTQSGEKRMISAVQEGNQGIEEEKKAHQRKKERRGEQKNLRKKKQFNIGRDCTTRETIPMKIFASSTGHPSTHHQEHGRHWISHVCGEQKKMVVQWNWSNKCGNI